MVPDQEDKKELTSSAFRARFFSVDNTGKLREELNGQKSLGGKGSAAETRIPKARLITPSGMVCDLFDEIILGRGSFVNVLPAAQSNHVSRVHCHIWSSSDRYYIEDGAKGKASTNGTKVNGTQIRGRGPVELLDGNEINLGEHLRLRFETVEPNSRDRRSHASPTSGGGLRGKEEGVQPGIGYLVECTDSAYAYGLLKQFLKKGVSACCVSTTHPGTIDEMHSLDLSESFWISDANDPTAVKPSRLDFELARGLKVFLGSNKNGLIFIEGVEYLISENGFDRVAHYLKKVLDWASPVHGTVITVVDPRSLNQSQIAVLERMFHRVIKS